MFAKLKSGKIVSGKIADLFVKINIATECDAPEKKVNKGRPKKVK